MASDVAVYVRLPDGFYISTPVGHYNPDWAIAFMAGTVKHIYFAAETKDSMDTMELRMRRFIVRENTSKPSVARMQFMML